MRPTVSPRPDYLLILSAASSDLMFEMTQRMKNLLEPSTRPLGHGTNSLGTSARPLVKGIGFAGVKTTRKSFQSCTPTNFGAETRFVTVKRAACRGGLFKISLVLPMLIRRSTEFALVVNTLDSSQPCDESWF